MISLSFCMAMIDSEEDQQTFAELCNKYKQEMFNLAMAITKDHYSAEDAISRVLVSLAKNISRLDTSQDERVKHYIYKTVKNACYDVLRQRTKEQQWVFSIDLVGELPDDDDIVAKIDSDEKYARIVKAILNMPEKWRDALALYYVDGISLTTIAKLLGRPVSTIKSRIERGTEQLREALVKENIYD